MMHDISTTSPGRSGDDALHSKPDHAADTLTIIRENLDSLSNSIRAQQALLISNKNMVYREWR